MKLFDYNITELSKAFLITNQAGSYFFTSKYELQKLKDRNLSKNFKNFLLSNGFGYEKENDFYYNSFLFKKEKRRFISEKISYLIIVPTLRCNLSCSYCQVSRANINAKGFDWNKADVNKLIIFIQNNCSENIKLEFQGGEPTLRMDLLKLIIKKVSLIKPKATFVICTNLQKLNHEMLELLENPNIQISTSIDGPEYVHNKQRINNSELTKTFFKNLEIVERKIGIGRLGALPTITNFKDYKLIIDFYSKLGFKEIFFRQVNYQGFARKLHLENAKKIDEWEKFYISALNYIEDINYSKNQKIIEVNLSLHLNRIFKVGANHHVDLRSPNPAANDYLVIDYDGHFYPSDEARMLTRIGLIDLKIGHFDKGFYLRKIAALNEMQDNLKYKCCRDCSFQPYCGIDIIDEISRYGKVQENKLNSHFCKMRMSTFKYIFEGILKRDKKTLTNFSGHLINDFKLNSIFSYSHYVEA